MNTTVFKCDVEGEEFNGSCPPYELSNHDGHGTGVRSHTDQKLSFV